MLELTESDRLYLAKWNAAIQQLKVENERMRNLIRQVEGDPTATYRVAIEDVIAGTG